MLTALVRRSVKAVLCDHVVRMRLLRPKISLTRFLPFFTHTSRRSSRSIALLSALAAFATSALAQAQDIHVVGVPLVTGAPIQFHRLPWPSTPVVVQRMIQDDYGFLWLSAADGLRRYDGYGLMRVPGSQNSESIGFIIGQSLTRDRSGRIWIGADDSLNLYDPVTGSFRQYRSPNEECGTVAIAHDINEDQDGLIWLATDDGITALDPVTSKTEVELRLPAGTVYATAQRHSWLSRIAKV